MSINERIKEVRTALNLTQKDFGQRLSIAQSYLTNIETGKREVTKKIQKLVCLQFNVNESWLSTGEGEMFVEADSQLINVLGQQYGLDSLDRKIIEEYINLPEIQRNVIKGFVRNLVASILSEDNYETFRSDYTSEIAQDVTPDNDFDNPFQPLSSDAEIEAEVEDYRRQLIKEKEQAEKSEVLRDVKEA